MSSERAFRFYFAASAGAVFLAYLAGAYPTLSPYRDSGDLAACAWTLGNAHPSGYPLYVLFGRAWLAWLPLGNVAYRLHVLSALCGALACALAAWALRRDGFHPASGLPALAGGEAGPAPEAARGASAAGLLAALLLAASPAFWQLCLVSEMYALNALWAAALLALGVPGLTPWPSGRRLRACAFLLGLGLGNHQTLAALIPPLLWVNRREISGAKPWVGASLFFLLGLSVYVCLPLRSWAGPEVDWGEPRGARALWRVLTRADYGGVRLHPERPMGLASPAAWLSGLGQSWRLFSGELGWLGCALAAWGAWAFRGSPLARCALGAFLLSGPLFILWANLDPAQPETYPILQPHLQLPLLFACVLAGLGARRLLASRRGVLLLLLLAAEMLWRRSVDAPWRRFDYSGWELGTALFASLPPRSVFLDPDDTTTFAASYLTQAHGRRRDVAVISFFRTRWGERQIRRRHPDLSPTPAGSGQELYRRVVQNAWSLGRPLFVDLPQKTPQGGFSFPWGVAYRVAPAPWGGAGARGALDASQALHELLPAPSAAASSDFFSRHALQYRASALNNLGVEAQRLGLRPRSEALYRRAAVARPDLAEAWNNLGNCALEAGRLAEAEGLYRVSLGVGSTPQGIYNLGRVYLAQGAYGRARDQFAGALELADLPEARNDIGLAYLREGKVREAIPAWLELLDRFPAYVVAYYNLALAYEKLGDKETALQFASLYLQGISEPVEKRSVEAWMRRLGKK